MRMRYGGSMNYSRVWNWTVGGLLIVTGLIGTAMVGRLPKASTRSESGITSPSATIPVSNPVPSWRTVRGEVLCLPHRDTSGPQTLECAIGLKASTGEYYALDLNRISGEATQYPTGTTIEAQGTLTPVEMLSSDHWRIYPITGIFSVTSTKNVQALER